MTIRTVRKKIKSFTSVKKITRAMQMVSAVKMKKYQQAAIEAAPYQQALERMIAQVSANSSGESSPFLEKHTADRQLVILVTTNKGLAGGFNVNLLRHLIKDVDYRKCDFITIGRKGREFVSRVGATVLADYSDEVSVDVSSAVFDQASKAYFEGKYEKVMIVYNQFISAVRFDPTSEVLLPLTPSEQKVEQETKGLLYTVEPSPEEVLNALFRSYLEERIRYVMLQNEAGEHSARMIAMKTATDNATELIYNLTLLRNKIRQENITYELLDMVTAQAAAV